VPLKALALGPLDEESAFLVGLTDGIAQQRYAAVIVEEVDELGGKSKAGLWVEPPLR
jgi:hypothetical protein